MLLRQNVFDGALLCVRVHMDCVTALQSIDAWCPLNNPTVRFHLCSRGRERERETPYSGSMYGQWSADGPFDPSPSATPQGYCLPRTRFPLTSIMVLLPTTAKGKRSCRRGGRRNNCCIAHAHWLKIHRRMCITRTETTCVWHTYKKHSALKTVQWNLQKKQPQRNSN